MNDRLDQCPGHRRRFDRAVVLFNAGAYFEAHEDWEELWHEAEGEERRWLQGLIQLAAAFVHFERGFFARGFAGLVAEAVEKLRDYHGPSWGLDLEGLSTSISPWTAHASRVRDGAPLTAGAPALRPHMAYQADYAPDPLSVEPSPETGD